MIQMGQDFERRKARIRFPKPARGQTITTRRQA